MYSQISYTIQLQNLHLNRSSSNDHQRRVPPNLTLWGLCRRNSLIKSTSNVLKFSGRGNSKCGWMVLKADEKSLNRIRASGTKHFRDARKVTCTKPGMKLAEVICTAHSRASYYLQSFCPISAMPHVRSIPLVSSPLVFTFNFCFPAFLSIFVLFCSHLTPFPYHPL